MIPHAEENDKTETISTCKALVPVPYEPVGRWLEACLRRQRHEKSTSISAEGSEAAVDDSDSSEDVLTEDEKGFLLSLDSKEWKKQDHYRVLGIGHLRYKASDEEIKKAFRIKVLKHHPDKKSRNKTKEPFLPGLNEHEYFTCITKACEVLGNPVKRRAFDSVDPTFDDSVPSTNSTSKEAFFKVFKPVFEQNSRWSKMQPVPCLGDATSTMEYVEDFYSFWYNFESWREFSYLDEEDKDKAESRDERRWMEKENRHMRQKRKKDEIARIRTLVDNAYACDPRIRNFKEKEKQKKLEEKKAKEEAAKERERQKQEAEEAERKAREAAEQQAREEALKAKKEKDRIKKMTAKERKALRQFVKDNNYFVKPKSDVVDELAKLERTLENLSLESLQELREASEQKSEEEFKDEYRKQVQNVEESLKKLEEEKAKTAVATNQGEADNKPSSSGGLVAANRAWSDDEMQLLVKATTLFPIGTASRWQVIANYVNEHASECQNRTAKQVINKVKELQKLDPSVKEDINKRAFEKLEKTTAKKVAAKSVADPSSRTPAEQEHLPPEKPWSSEEQKEARKQEILMHLQLLEQALKTYPASTPERWDRIAESVSTRTKKECMKRYKELVEMVKAKKAAQSQAQAQTTSSKKAKS